MDTAWTSGTRHLAQIVLDHLQIRRSAAKTVHAMNLEIPAGHVLALIGPEKSGKTSLLLAMSRMLSSQDPLASIEGHVWVDQEDMLDDQTDERQVRRYMGFISAATPPFPISIFDNIAFGLRLMGRKDPAYIRWAVEEHLRQVDLWDIVRGKLHREAHTLPLGLQRRLCIARTLAVEPKVLLLDDLTAGLDPVAVA
ncbi:MAG: ATP-binding cassette domain-containing protein, partial [Firmicutes bacterium]|nr:ATP-binding cassette domain-containing protein [Bacillota bacterium]